MEISIKDAAELLGKSERTVRHMAQTGRLPARRIGSRWLINRDDLLARKAAGLGNDSDEPDGVDAPDDAGTDGADGDPAELAADDSSEDSSPRRTSRQGFTVNFAPSHSVALPPGAVTSVRELDSFHIATDILAELGELRREVKDAAPLRDAETHLREFLQLLADGCHADLATRRDRFQAAQSQACAALTDLIHFNVSRAEPDLGPLGERVERDLIGSLRMLLEDTQRHLSVRGRVLDLAERAVARVLSRLRGLAGEGRMADRLGGLQKSLTEALHAAR
jgi:excisionase family DNA binding protein